jgi:hypothetical protein
MFALDRKRRSSATGSAISQAKKTPSLNPLSIRLTRSTNARAAASDQRGFARVMSPLEREAEAAATAVAPVRANLSGGSGGLGSGPADAPLQNADRFFMEERFGHDLSRVRVHADDYKGMCLVFNVNGTSPVWRLLLPICYIKTPRKFSFAGDRPDLTIRAVLSPIFLKAWAWRGEREWRAINLHGPGPRRYPRKDLLGIISRL